MLSVLQILHNLAVELIENIDKAIELSNNLKQIIQQGPTEPASSVILPPQPPPEKKKVLLKRFRNTKTISAARSLLRPVSPNKRKLTLDVELAEAVK